MGVMSYILTEWDFRGDYWLILIRTDSMIVVKKKEKDRNAPTLDQELKRGKRKTK